MAEESLPFDKEHFLKHLTSRPGVYRMLDDQGRVLYVGKAGNLKKRVASYFRSAEQLSPKTRTFMAQMRSVEVMVTRTEGEALLLENNLIKEFSPRYNILLRDDKSYPYLYLSSHQEFPRLSLHRGARSGKGRYFGPYPNAGAVRSALNLLQKLFRIRPCSDSFFRHRSRACLQYQIKRCTAPCVGFVDEPNYAEDVRHAVMFLEGKSREVNEELERRMQQASARLEFEQAALYRDQIARLRKVQEQQCITTRSGELDVIAALCEGGGGTIQAFFIRDGRNLGNRAFFPSHAADANEGELLRAFLTQYYLNPDAERTIPAEILISHEIEDRTVLVELLTKRAGRRVAIGCRSRGERAKWVRMAAENARLALAQRLSSADSTAARLGALQEALGLDELPSRIECFDISHTGGNATVASCVVFGSDGLQNGDYRRFNIRGIQAGDDYAAMHQALTRRYTRVQKEEGRLPDLLLIDGGKGQVKEAVEVLEELQASGPMILGVAKGPGRKPGCERLFLPGSGQPLILPPSSPALHLIQQIRDEAHRFAITAHRKQRSKGSSRSILEDLPGIGPKRRRQLLKQFGGLQGLSQAGVDDLTQVSGISRQLAQSVYDAFHETP